MKSIKFKSILAGAGVVALAGVSILGAHADTATVAITGASGLTINSSNVDFGSVVLNGSQQIATAYDATQTTDNTGTGNGWNVSLSADYFHNGDGNPAHDLAPGGLSLTSMSQAGTSQNPSAFADNSATLYPVQVPENSPVKMFVAAPNTGQSTINEQTGAALKIPANAYQGSYSSTWTVTINVGP